MEQNPPHSFYASFPILAISILGILTTACLLLSYYIFVIKCCLDWRRSDLLLYRFSHSRRQFTSQIFHHANEVARGLDSSTINSIPTCRFVATTNSTLECAVCLVDFQEQELLRFLPNCKHLFHIDCIDTWLQSNPNCPLCRAAISLLPVLQLNGSTSNSSTLREEDSSVVIEVRDSRRFWHVKSKGDECIDMREKDEQFVVQPIRRSFSMDSSNDRGLYTSVQEILRQNTNFVADGSSSSSNGGGGRIRRSLFSFGRSSRNASVLPVQSEFL